MSRVSLGRPLTARGPAAAREGLRPHRLARTLRDVAGCRACPTTPGWRKFSMGALGNRDGRFVLVGEAPGIASLENARQWTGAGGMVLRREIRRLGLDLEDLFYLTNAVKCWPAAESRPGRRPGNRPPLASEARRCRPYLLAELDALRPEVVVAVGAVATRAILGDQPVRLPDDHGRRFRQDGREVIVLLHPANASRHRGVWPTYRASLLELFAELAGRAGFPVVEVAAAILARRGRFLVTRRDPAKHLGGLWEFPGGKREPGESIEQCLLRELDEELGVRVQVGPRLALVPWAYPDRCVLLHFFRCRAAGGGISPREHQPYRWVTPSELAALPMPPADAALIARLTGRSRDQDDVARNRRPLRPRRAGSRRGSRAT